MIYECSRATNAYAIVNSPLSNLCSSRGRTGSQNTPLLSRQGRRCAEVGAHDYVSGANSPSLVKSWASETNWQSREDAGMPSLCYRERLAGYSGVGVASRVQR